jgi:OOP family OmpA-OmpF porin
MTRFNLAAACSAALLGIAGAGPALSAEKGWYTGAGVGYANGDIDTSSINQQLSVMNPGATTNTISKDTNGLLYKIFLGYNFTSFVALEANAFWLSGFAFDATTTPSGTYNGSADAWGLSVDVLGIIPLGENWRIFGRAGGLYARTDPSLVSTIGSTTTVAGSPAYNVGYKFGAGVGYEFESGVAFRAEWEQYHLDDGLDGNLVVDAYSASFLYRFK